MSNIELSHQQIVFINKLLLDASDMLCDYASRQVVASIKNDGTQVTAADIAVNEFITGGLAIQFPHFKLVSEESEFDHDILSSDQAFFCLDPLDGTDAYVEGHSEYVINLALVQSGRVINGWIAHPPSESLYFCHKNQIYKLRDRRDIEQVKYIPPNDDVYIMPKAKRSSVPTDQHDGFVFQSSALKFITLVNGTGSALIQTHHTKIWDVAAGFAFMQCLNLEPISSLDYCPIPLNNLDIDPFYINTSADEELMIG